MRKLQVLLPMLLLALFGIAQQKNITGKVTGKTSGEPLQGVTVTVGSRSVQTDAAGKYTIAAAPGETLTFSFVGMTTQKMRVSSTTAEFNLTMEESNSDLNTVVVTGYKSEKKVDLTGAVSVVNLSAAKTNPVASPMLALQGQVPGLYIQTDGSPTGANGGAPTVIIRGVNNLNGLGNTNPPLYIIDGVPTTRYEDFANLNLNAIASMQVLKDASAASIYGSRAANGVIIVTTKDGTTSGGRTRIALSSSLTWQTERPWQQPVLSAHDRGVALWRAAVNDSTDPNQNSTKNIYTYTWNGDYTNPVLNSVNIAPFVGGDSLEPAASTNWQNALYRTALVTSNDIAISNGNSKTGFLLDLGYYNNDGLMQFTHFQRYSARINSHTTAFDDKLRFGENLQLSRTSQVNSTTDVGGDAVGDLALTLAPTIPLYKTDGTYGGPVGAGYSDRNNPVDMQFLNRWNTTNLFLATGNIYVELEPVKNLVLRTSLGFDYSDGLGKVIKQTGQEGPVNSTNSLSMQESKDFTFTWTNTANYNLLFGRHRLNLLAGIEAVRDDFSTFGAANTNFAIQDVNYFVLSSGSGAQTDNGSATGYRLLSQFGKVFYSYADRYLASFTIRRDGSSRFGTNNPYGVFPAFTLGWRINNEDFFRNTAARTNISNLKLRAGIGTVGNQQIGNLAAYTLYYANYGTASAAFPLWLNTGTAYDINGVNTGTLPSGFVQTQRGNPNLKWEQTTETNVGLDFGFWNETLTGSFDYFHRNTSNILIQPPVAGAVGEGQLEFLNGASKSTKGWEAVVGYHSRTSSGLGYGVTVNADHWADVITQLPEDVRAAYPGDPNHSIIGHSQFSIFGYQTQGLFQSWQEVASAPAQPGAAPGRIRYVDQNHDGKIDVTDQTWLGTTLPKVEYGIRIDLSYKSFDFSIFGSGVAGKTGFDPVKFMNSFIDTRNNYGPGVLSAWTPQNTGSKTPALSILNRNFEDRVSDFFYVNASYFKIRQAQLGYNLPAVLARSVKMESLRLYVSGQNLIAFKHKNFLSKDPERANSFALWPVPTSYTFGINANF
ncbi:SusC/RagA family TonB-linked outer membrane protein [Puia dinghuensis]|uniref:SusC/RagA family TonB-linked outer membrane protein n=1 Tax=Puia dinghuensis TaxID=1792502 RepID=A0A8J2UB47_9BACT|nr:SusC/RagA family TonB-linked outer membrane protein [Puia dinghuensis]GGA90671.1 SusC/RagA family TonB-linked outer membrane protein [Puia dinghuensis]